MTYLTISDLVDCGDIPASTWRRNGFGNAAKPFARDVDGEPLLDPQMAAWALEISVNTLRQWKKRDKITPARRGPHGSWLYRQDEVARVARQIAARDVPSVGAGD